MPSPWVTRALRQELPAKSLDSFAPANRQSLSDGATADEMIAGVQAHRDHDILARNTAGITRDITGDPADAFGSIRALRAFGIVR